MVLIVQEEFRQKRSKSYKLLRTMVQNSCEATTLLALVVEAAALF